MCDRGRHCRRRRARRELCEFASRQPQFVLSAGALRLGLMTRLGFAERLHSYHPGIGRIARVEDVASQSVHIAINSNSRLTQSTLRPGPIGAVRLYPKAESVARQNGALPTCALAAGAASRAAKTIRNWYLFIRSPRPREAVSMGVSQGRAPWRSCGSRPSRTWSGAAPGDRPASRREGCDRHRRRRDERCLPGRFRRRANRRFWQSQIPNRPPVRCNGDL